MDLGKWLQDRMLAQKEAFAVARKQRSEETKNQTKKKDDRITLLGLTNSTSKDPVAEKTLVCYKGDEEPYTN